MIYLNRLDGKSYVLNGLLIETIEETPDTMITLTTGKKLIVKQSRGEVITQFEDFIRRTHGIQHK